MPGLVDVAVDQLRALSRRFASAATPWFLRPRGGLAALGMMPTLPNGYHGGGLRWGLPNPFDEYRDLVGEAPIWPIRSGTAIGRARHGAAIRFADGAAAAQWRDVISEFTNGDVIHAAVAFNAGRAEVSGYRPERLSALRVNWWGKPC